MKNIKGKIGLMAASFLMMSFLAPNSVLAQIAEAFPQTSLQMVQMITTMPSLVGLVVALLIGKVTPYIYKRSLILISTLLYIVGGLLPYFFHGSVEIILACIALLGVGMGVMLTCVASLICDCYEEKESSALLGIQAAFISGGGMVFLWLGGQLGKERWENSFLAYILVIVILLIEVVCLPKGKLDRKMEQGQGKTKIPGSIWFYAILGFFVYVFITIFNSNVPMLVEIRALGGPVEASYASMSYTFAGMIAGCTAGIIISKIKQQVFTLSILLAVAGMGICFFGSGLPTLCLGGILCGAAFSMFTPAGNFYAAQGAGADNRSICIAVFASLSNMGQALSPILVGFFLAPLTIEQRFAAAAVGFVILAIAAFCGIKRIQKGCFKM